MRRLPARRVTTLVNALYLNASDHSLPLQLNAA